MVVTLFVSAPITCTMFETGHENFDTKYSCLSATNSNGLQLYNRIHYARSAIVTTYPTTRVCCVVSVVTQPGVNCNNKTE